MDVYEAIKRRRDLRSYYINKPIPDEVLAKLLLAAHLAPSVGFSQPWNFIVIKDIKIRERIKALVEEQRKAFEELLPMDRRKIFERIKVEAILDTPVNLAVTCDPSRFGPHVLGRMTIPETCQYSVVLAVENLWLAATAEGIGVGWVSFFRKEKVKKILNIPKEIDLVAYLTLGYVTSFPEKPELEEKGWLKRLPLDSLVFLDVWNKRPSGEFIKALREVKI